MSWVEFVDQATLQYSNVSGFFGTRVFKVWNVDRSVIITRPQDCQKNPGGTAAGDTETLPTFDSEWTYSDGDRATGVTLEQYSVNKIGTELVATALYTDRRTRNRYSATFQTQQSTLEYQAKRPLFVPSSSASPTVPLYSWADYQRTIFSTLIRFQLVKYIQYRPAITDIGDIDYFSEIARQTNKLHNFSTTDATGNPSNGNLNGPWFKFEGGDVQQIAYDRFVVTYSWSYDSGTKPGGPLFQPFEDEPDVRIAEPFSYPRLKSKLYNYAFPGSSNPSVDETEWWRPPFEVVAAYPDPDLLIHPERYVSTNGTTPLPLPPKKYIGQILYPIDPLGWRRLPGMS